MRNRHRAVLALGATCLAGTPVLAQTAAPADAPAVPPAGRAVSVAEQLRQARAEIESQRRALVAQEARLIALESRMEEAARASQSESAASRVDASPAAAAVAQNTDAPAGVEQVGEGPAEIELPAVAVLGEMGSVVTRAGQITVESTFEYARADRNRFLFRGIGAAEVVLIGQFDINESRQDVLTATAGARYGLSDRFEVGFRVPYVYRSDTSIITPIRGSGSLGNSRDASAKGDGIGDLEFSARYQLLSARRGSPFVIANLQVVAPTGTSGFEVPRDDIGSASRAATGSGFWSVSPSFTAILPTDPAVLFASLGYSYNFAENVDTKIGDVLIERVEPGQSLAGSFGIGVSLNQRTSFNLGYAHSWVFGTKTSTRPFMAATAAQDVLRTSQSRDLQLGRLLFGITYRLNNRANLNWSVEVGATEDATDLRTVLRIPFVL